MTQYYVSYRAHKVSINNQEEKEKLKKNSPTQKPCLCHATFILIVTAVVKRNCQTANPLFPSHATIFTLSTLAISCASRNSTSFNMKVHTLSQKRYVFSLPACKTVSILISSRRSFSFRRWNNGSLSPDVVVAVMEFTVNFYGKRYDSNFPHLTIPPNTTNNRSQMRGNQSHVQITMNPVGTVPQQNL